MELVDVWFILISVLWVGYFFLEGFDFGVGILLPFIGKNDNERRLVINSIGPIWDGNEVWLLVAGGATFAAFPEWYATLFSGFYLPLFLILLGLIIRGVAFEYRGKYESETTRRRWDWTIFVGSLIPALLWGVAFANIVKGVKIVQYDSAFRYIGGFFSLLNPYALLGGIVTLLVFLLHGSLFLALKNTGELRERALKIARAICIPAISLTAIFLLWTLFDIGTSTVWSYGLTFVTASAAVISIVMVFKRSEGKAFAAMGVAIAFFVITLFENLYPMVMPSSINDAFSLTVHNASSTPYTLKVMTIVAVIFVPIVVGYQAWSYWVFRKRLKLPSDH